MIKSEPGGLESRLTGGDGGGGAVGEEKASGRVWREKERQQPRFKDHKVRQEKEQSGSQRREAIATGLRRFEECRKGAVQYVQYSSSECGATK